jgi:hypothetical protein
MYTNSYLQIHTYEIVLKTNLHIKLTCVNSYNTNCCIQIRTDLRLVDSKKTSNFQKRASPLSPGMQESVRLVPKN